jgi:multidrug efflux pump
MKLTNICLDNRTAVVVSVLIVTIMGVIAYLNLPLESFPEIEQPVIFVSVPYAGVSPRDMETLVAKPIEDKLKEIAKIKTLSSTSREGYTSIVAEFQSDIEVDEALRRVREKVDQARPELPVDASEPIVQEINFENIPILVVAITGPESLVKLKEIAEDLQDKIELVPGVLSVSISGGLEREVKVNVNPNRLVHYNLSVDDVIGAIASANMTIPGGSTESSSLKWTIRVPGDLESLDQLRDVIIESREGRPILLRDLAEVSFGFKEAESYNRLNGAPSVSLAVQKRTGENILALADGVKDLLAKERPKFPAGVHDVIVADFSRDIRLMVSDLNNNIIAGLLLVVGVLYFFMGARNGLLVGIAIPLSMFMTYLVLQIMGYTLNMITLYTLILALGMLVDNAVVVVENIYRQYHDGKPLLQAAKDASAEVAVPVITSTLTTLAAFAPMIFWPGIIGSFMKVLPITLIITLSCSLVVALTINPVFSSMFIRHQGKSRNMLGDVLLQRWGGRYENMLAWLLATKGRRRGFLLSVAGGFVAMLVVFAKFNHGVEFFPTMDPQQIYVDVEAPLGTRLEVSDVAVREIEKRLQGTPDVRNVLADVGTKQTMFDFGSSGGTPHKSRVTIDMLDKADRSQSSVLTLEQVREKLQGIPGVKIDVSKPEEGPPTGRAVQIRLKGADFAVLSRLAEDVEARIKDVPGLTKLDDDYEEGRPELRVRIDRQKAGLGGLSTTRVASTIRTAINGTVASKYRVGTDEYDIIVRFDKDYRRNYNDILDLTVFSEGVHRPLANLATVDLATGLSSVNHVDGERVITVGGDAVGRSAAEVLADAQKRLAGFTTPEGYTYSFAGQDEEQKAAMGFLGNAFLIAVMLVFLILVIQFDSVTVPIVIMTTVPLSLFGAFFGLLVTFMPFGIVMTGVGVISLAGVVVNNAIILLEYTRQLRDSGLEKVEAIVKAGRTRLRPVLLTAITAILGLIPLTTGVTIDFLGLFKGDLKHFVTLGAESAVFWSGMGVVVIFGLAFATILTLVAVPVLYYGLADLPEAIRQKFSRAPRSAEDPETKNGRLSA